MPVAIVLPLPAAIAARVALPSSVPGALPPGDMHLTLAVLTSAPADAVEVLGAVAPSVAPISAMLSGVGRFSGQDGDAFHLTVDAAALVALRATLEQSSALRPAIDRTHGFDPHVTLAYLAPDAAAPLERFGAMPVTFDTLALWDGDARTTFPLGNTMDSNVATLDALPLPVTIPSELRLFAEGWNDTTKGRFLLDADGVAEVLRRFRAHGVELALDFDHATFGEPGPKRDVPGYIGDLEHRAGDGLYATRVRWTEVGLRAITPGRAPDGAPTLPEYRYFSPAIDFDGDSRRILGLRPVALVSYPATLGQRPLVMSAAAAPPRPETRTMKNVLALLGLAADADESTILAAVQNARNERNALLGALGATDLSSALGKITALGAARTELDAAQKRAADAEGRIEASERREMLAAGKAAGKLTPALEKLYEGKPVAELKAYLDAAPVIAALAPKAPPQQPPAASLSTGVAGVPDKPFEQLSALEKDRLLRGNTVAFEQSLAAFEARGGDGSRYRRALASLKA